MKKLMTLLVLVLVTVVFVSSCGDDKASAKTTTTTTTTTKAEEPKKEAAPTTTAGDPAKGKELFAGKTCSSCHAPDKKVVGPSIQDIAKKYASAGDIVKFLEGKADAIVDTDPGQVAVMKGNIDGILKDVTAAEKADIAAYMMSLK